MAIYLTLRIKVVPQIEKGIPCCEALLENLLKVEFCCLVVCHFTEVSSRHSTLKICQQPEGNPGQDQPKETNFDLGELLVALRATLRAWTTNLPGTRANALPESMISICRNFELIQTYSQGYLCVYHSQSEGLQLVKIPSLFIAKETILKIVSLSCCIS